MSLLRVDGLTKRFGGVNAIEGVTFSVASGDVHSIIGPNGAGKTTLINLVTGLYVPTQGRISFDGNDIAGRPPHRLPELGIARTFQNLQVCMNMSALENVMVGAHLRLNSGLLAGLLSLRGLRRADAQCRQDAALALERVGLGALRQAHASQMPYGALKRLEIARALLTRPRLLLMDEPAAGLNATETAEIGTLIRDLSAQGLTVVLVEHDMPLVMGVSDRITVLDHGRTVAEGSPAEVRADPDVIAAYLGSDIPASAASEPLRVAA